MAAVDHVGGNDSGKCCSGFRRAVVAAATGHVVGKN